jgi:hypothetical protein
MPHNGRPKGPHNDERGQNENHRSLSSLDLPSSDMLQIGYASSIVLSFYPSK